MPRFSADMTAASLRASLRTSRTLCRASTRFARTTRRTWGPAPKPTPGARTRRPGLLARLFGRR